MCLLREAGVGWVRYFCFWIFLQKFLVSICLGVFSLWGEKWRCDLDIMLMGSRRGNVCSCVVVCGFELSVPVRVTSVLVVWLEVAMLRRLAVLYTLPRFGAPRGLSSPISY